MAIRYRFLGAELVSDRLQSHKNISSAGLISSFLMVFTAIGLTGCSLPAENYRSSVKDVQELRNNTYNKVGLGEFSAKGGESKVNQFSMRGSSLVSPDGSFAAYMEHAIRDELKRAGRFDPESQIKLSGMLLKNSIDASGFSVGTADLEAEFTVTKKGQEIYRKIKTIHYEWPSSFAGAVALPAVQSNYPVAVQKLLESLFSDQDFLIAMK